jgi:hypothetical protein
VELSKFEQRPILREITSIIIARRVRHLPVTESVVLPPFQGSGRMPAYQSLPELDLSAKYHLKAVGCEHQAGQATDQATEQQWRELAAQWLSMADQAATMSGDASRAELAW